MLERVITINNVGVMKTGVPKALDFEKVTLIYADNARGKSTLSVLLQACAEADEKAVQIRKTVGATGNQNVILRFGSKAGGFTTQFDGEAWGGGQPQLYVFNQEFVERNVYTSTGVTPDQRASLLNFALGATAVTQQKKFNEQSELQRSKAGEVRAAEIALTGFRGELSVDQFMALSVPVQADTKLSDLEKRIVNAKAVAQVLVRPEFKKLTNLQVDLDRFKKIAASTLEMIQSDAEGLIDKHIEKHKGALTERWIAEGLNHIPVPECPFCGQETEGLALIEAYKTYFNQKYKDHLADVACMKSLAMESLPKTLLQSWVTTIAFNDGAAGQWQDSFEFVLPIIDVAVAQNMLNEVLKGLMDMAVEKVASPFEVLDINHVLELERQLSLVNDMAEAFNVMIEQLNKKIITHKKGLQAVSLDELKAQKRTLEMQVARHDLKTIPLIEGVKSARAEYKAAEVAKNEAKTKLDELMAKLLADFQQGINDWLVRFGAPFSLEKMSTSYAGGDPRSQYVINVRGAKVIIGPGSEGDLPFNSALSDGDKRTLAFALFLTKLFAQSNRDEAIIVLDDVFTSLDAHRRHNTGEAILKISQECAQVVVLGHDAHFLRGIRKRLIRKGIGGIIEFCLQRDSEDYSLLSTFDLDEFCASEYYKNYILAEKFLAGQVRPERLLDVAKALRPLIEGHLHRSFPGRFKDGKSFGDMLGVIRSAPASCPLVTLQPLLTDLNSFNDFAGAYHHDTSGGHPRTDITDSELKKFTQAALNFIQQRKFW